MNLKYQMQHETILCVSTKLKIAWKKITTIFKRRL